MKLDDYKKMYEKMETSPEMDERILKSLQTKKEGRKGTYMKVASVAAAIALLVGIYQIPSVNAAVNDFISSFTNKVEINNETVEMTGEYKQIKKDVCKENRKFDTLSDVEKELGIKLLKSEQAYEGDKHLIDYNPHISESGEMYGAMIMDDFYVIGDLKNVKIKTFKEFSDVNDIKYDPGTEFKSPISTEITVRTQTENEDNKSGDHELEYYGKDEDFGTLGSELYEIKSLGVKAVISVVKGSGTSSSWNTEDSVDMTYTMFVYNGVEYKYYGVVSRDTMKAFLDGLKY